MTDPKAIWSTIDLIKLLKALKIVDPLDSPLTMGTIRKFYDRVYKEDIDVFKKR